MNFHNIQQNTDTWFDLRIGKITASNFGTIMANYGKAFGEPAKRYAMRIALESVIGHRIETYQNENMTRGIELEPKARELYEIENEVTVINGGFMTDGIFGGSADGIIPGGIIEIKSVLYSTHFERYVLGGYDTSYQWQIQGNIWLYEVDFCDFISYCPEFPPNKRLYVFRVKKDAEAIGKLKERLNDFSKLVIEYTGKIK